MSEVAMVLDSSIQTLLGVMPIENKHIKHKERIWVPA
jgi:hypothetical protein